ncbi:MAG: hypothetical protein LBK59_12450 [Bifidobacteriaceae bacterium]|nr:hypothetical protein [Bifidobacteriaceae bacterium]
MRARGTWVCGVVVGALVAMAGCTAADDNVTSVDDLPSAPASVAPVPDSQRERAEAMAACLAGKSISTSLEDQKDGQALLTIDSPPGALAWVPGPAGGPVYGAREGTETYEMVNAAESEGRTLLWLGGTDRTADYDACVAATHFTQPGPYVDTTAERRLKQLATDLNNNFAACARANGFPDVEDVPPPVIDGGATWMVPPVLLPLSMTTDEFVDLFAQCPTYDEGRLRELADGEYSGTEMLGGLMGPNYIHGLPCEFGLPCEGQTRRERTDDEEAHSEELYEAQEAEARRQFEEIIAKLRAEGITYKGPGLGELGFLDSE